MGASFRVLFDDNYEPIIPSPLESLKRDRMREYFYKTPMKVYYAEVLINTNLSTICITSEEHQSKKSFQAAIELKSGEKLYRIGTDIARRKGVADIRGMMKHEPDYLFGSAGGKFWGLNKQQR